MYIKQFLTIFFLNIYAINAGILLWSNKKVEISPLLPFDDGDLENLVKELDVEKVFLFKVALKNRNAIVPRNLKEVMDGYHSAYNPNGNIGTSNAVELTLSEDCNGIDTTKIQKTTGKLTNSTDFLCVLDITYPRKKRSLDDKELSENKTKDVKSVPEKDTVIYIGENIIKTSKHQHEYALLYSSKALKLEINDTVIDLGKTNYKSPILDDTRFNIFLGLEEKEARVNLRFSINRLKNGYWYLSTAKLELVHDINTVNFDLYTNETIMAPAHFSYHCNGQSVFTNARNSSSNITLTIYDIQVQFDAKKARFGDAYDCVPFTTAPIWSGLFVTTILGLGLIVAISAIMDIKTMDKFDNQTTKNLGITVMD